MTHIIKTELGQVAFSEQSVTELVALGHTESDAITLVKQAIADMELNTVIEQRKQAYKLEADPLYMAWQFDQTPEAEQKWRAKVEEIKARYPKPMAQPAA